METAMSMNAIALHTSAADLLARVRRLAASAAEVYRAFRSRREMRMLAGFDDRMLADIGLNRSDVRDAVSEPLWRDPTRVLVRRARERRLSRPATYASPGRVAPPPIVPAQAARARRPAISARGD
jgi:uncharacterized protein YjiS (DUF1127 family)